MHHRLGRLVLALALVALGTSVAFAQGGSTKTALSGTVIDTGGGVIPGATVTVKNNDTGISLNVVTNGEGAFAVPALDPGTYTVTIALAGFKTAIIKEQRLVAASPASIKVTLEVGALTETVEVAGGTELVQTQSAAVSSTLFTEQLKTIPLPTRNALYAVTLLPGVDTVGSPRDATIAGLPEQAINITLDGVNVNNNMQKSSDGFYAMVRPQLDAIEQVTLTTATQGAESAGQGAVQIRFVTRSGTNAFKGTAYHYFRHPSLNTNYWFNEKNGLDKNRVILHQIGGSQGGPIVIPGLVDGRGKAFFFFNYEEFYQPTEATRTRTIMSPEAESGIFRYSVTVNGQPVVRSVNLLDLAAANGQIATWDPTIKALLAQVRAATATTGIVTTPTGALTTQSYLFQSPGKGVEHLPTSKVDFNLSPKHRLSGTYYWQEINRYPDIQNGQDNVFPGFPSFGEYLSHRTVGSITLRSTLGANLVNEFITGWQWSPSYFAANLTREQFANQGGFSLGLPFMSSVTGVNGGEKPRNTPNWNIDNNVNWQKGNHSLSFGGSMTQIRQIDTVITGAPTVSIGVQTALDPADAMFTTANFEGASNGNLNDARSLYAMITGRITAINGTARLDDASQYQYIGPTTDLLRVNEFGAFVQDSWRVSPTLTVNAGLRWEVQAPVVALNGNYSTATLADICGASGPGTGPGGRACNLFQPGVFNAPGMVPQYIQYSAKTQGFKTDLNNIAPNFSAAWRPNVQDGFLRKILGDPEQATIRAGFSIAYNRNGMDEFQNIFGGNPGRTTNANRNNTLGNLVPAGGTWPILLRETNRLGPPDYCTAAAALGCIPVAPVYPLVATTANSISIFDPDIQLMYTKSYQIGLQRALSKDMAIEIRYVGNSNKDGWTTENWNETNIYTNNFLDEFKTAQANLRAHVNAGCGTTGQPVCTFAYRGEGTGTAPLPIYLAHFNGQATSNAGNAALYTGTNWTNTTFVGRLNQLQPSVANAANDLFSSATFRTSMLAAGLPTNFWVMNPSIANANVRTSGTSSKYHSMQMEVRRRLAQGLLINANYTYARTYGSQLDSIHFDRYLLRSTNVPHSFKINGFYEVPIGRGKRFGSNMSPWLDRVAGGWTVSMTGRVQVRTLSISNAKLVGMTEQELQKAYRIRIDATRTVTMMPADIILNTRRAFSTSATSATGYGSLGVPEGRYIAPASAPGCVRVRPGDCGEPKAIFITSPAFTMFDLTLKKQIAIGGRRTLDVQVDVNNLFEAINFTPVFNPGSGETIFQTNAGFTDISQSFNPGGRLMQIVWRVNW